jgi:hypothetical protein
MFELAACLFCLSLVVPDMPGERLGGILFAAKLSTANFSVSLGCFFLAQL